MEEFTKKEKRVIEKAIREYIDSIKKHIDTQAKSEIEKKYYQEQVDIAEQVYGKVH
jgi:hypothetical protein